MGTRWIGDERTAMQVMVEVMWTWKSRGDVGEKEGGKQQQSVDLAVGGEMR